MRRRIYFVLPDADTAHEVEKALLLAHIDDRHMHFLAQDESGLSDLPLADFSQRSDIIPGMEHGLLIGGLAGAALGAIYALLPSLGFASGTGMVLVLTIVGAIMGVWISGMIGISAPNSRLKRFQKALEKGQILLMVDVPKDRVEEISMLVQRHHRNTRNYGEDPTIPAFP